MTAAKVPTIVREPHVRAAKANVADAREAWESGPPPGFDDDQANEPQAERQPPQTLWAPELATAVAPLVFASKDLTIAPGRPTVFAGKGGARKGWFAMNLMLCAAAGMKVLGRFP